MRELSKGDLVIMNTTDAPEAKNICIVTSIKTLPDYRHKIYAKYICEHTSKIYGRKKYCVAVRESLECSSPTLIADFGVDFFYDENIATGDTEIVVFKEGQSTAKYEDGIARNWQGVFDDCGYNVGIIRKDFNRVFKSFLITIGDEI